jgi:hypothetical protein
VEGRIKPPHRRTGRRKGAPIGSAHALKHGRTTAVALARRREVMALLRRCREAIESLRKPSQPGEGPGA